MSPQTQPAAEPAQSLEVKLAKVRFDDKLRLKWALAAEYDGFYGSTVQAFLEDTETNAIPAFESFSAQILENKGHHVPDISAAVTNAIQETYFDLRNQYIEAGKSLKKQERTNDLREQYILPFSELIDRFDRRTFMDDGFLNTNLFVRYLLEYAQSHKTKGFEPKPIAWGVYAKPPAMKQATS